MTDYSSCEVRNHNKLDRFKYNKEQRRCEGFYFQFSLDITFKRKQKYQRRTIQFWKLYFVMRTIKSCYYNISVYNMYLICKKAHSHASQWFSFRNILVSRKNLQDVTHMNKASRIAHFSEQNMWYFEEDNFFKVKTLISRFQPCFFIFIIVYF